MGGNVDDSAFLHHFIKIYGRWIDTMDGVHISIFLFGFCTLEHLKASENMLFFGGVIFAFFLHP